MVTHFQYEWRSAKLLNERRAKEKKQKKEYGVDASELTD
jgi:hypothetical protein